MTERHRARYALLLLSFGLCLGTGMLRVAIREGDNPAQLADATVTPDPGGEGGVLVLGVDDLQSVDPTLLAVWFVQSPPLGDRLELTGISTDWHPENSPLSNLQRMFSFTEEPSIAPSFLNALSEGGFARPEAILIMDEVAFSALIDYMGGITFRGDRMDGEEVSTALRLLYEEPEEALKTQVRIVEELVKQINLLENPPDLSRLTPLIPDHVLLSVPQYRVMEVLSLHFPLRSEFIGVRALNGDNPP